jgi:hypothetical protein
MFLFLCQVVRIGGVQTRKDEGLQNLGFGELSMLTCYFLV